MEFKDIAGVCPVCGGPLIYGENAVSSKNGSVDWTCQDCGATGKRSIEKCSTATRMCGWAMAARYRREKREGVYHYENCLHPQGGDRAL